VSNRGDHSFIGLFTPSQPIRFVAPSTSRDSSPIWSMDGKQLAYLRQPGAGGAPRSPLAEPESTWAVMVANTDAAAGADPTQLPARAALTSGAPPDAILRHPGGIRLEWAADDTLVFLGYRDGWPHLYSLRHPASGGRPLLLTPGAFMVEQFTLTPDRRTIVYSANTGADRLDVDRRHLFKVPIDAATPTALTSGSGIEWSPAPLSDGQTVAFLRSDPRQPPLPAAAPLAGGAVRSIAGDHRPGRLSHAPTGRAGSGDVPRQRWASRRTVNCSSRAAVRHGGRLLSMCTAAVLGRCCSAGTIAGNTPTTTA